ASVLGGCGGGGSTPGSSPAQGNIVGLNGITFTSTPIGTVPPPVFRDQAITMEFDGPINPAPLGGLYAASVGGAPVVFTGVSASTASGVQYHAFANLTLARASVQVLTNTSPGVQLPSYIVGRLVSNPNVLVIDPRVDPTNPFGLPSSTGFPNPLPASFVYHIPTNSSLFVGTSPVPTQGANLFTLPLAPTAFGTSATGAPPGFQVQNSSGPDPVPPQIVSVTALSGKAGTPADPIDASDPLIITFSKPISYSTINILKNLRIRNIDVLSEGQPITVPGAIVPNIPGANPNTPPDDVAEYIFLPTGSYGPGVSPSEGYDIEVKIGTGYPDLLNAPNILGIPTGFAQTQLPLANSLNAPNGVVFRTTPTPGLGFATKVEGFDDNLKQDATFSPQFGPARWNAASDPGKLSGRLMTGSPLGNTAIALGTRAQFKVEPSPLATNGLFSPFDASAAATTACGANCGVGGCNIGVNPNGGSHIMHLYEAADSGVSPGTGGTMPRDALELVEWAPLNQIVIASVYPSMTIWAGLTNTPAPISGTCTGGGGCGGLNNAYGFNYNLLPFQSNDPTVFEVIPATQGGNGTNGRVRVYNTANYTAQPSFGEFYPYPLFNTPFDYANSNGTGGTGVNLLLEMNIETGTQCPNFHRYRATANTPVRRLIGPPISQVPVGQAQTSSFAGFDIYKMRFTFVGRRSSARSLWYDTGVAAPLYSNFQLVPSPVPGTVQPAGTTSVWTMDVKGGTSLPTAATAPDGSQQVVDATGAVNNVALTNLSAVPGRRFFRFRVDMVGNTFANTVPSFDNLIVVYQF
ncbi:MAG TPA: hypothetical protein VEI02_16100, partial [Planctomycetota bacterium]|nr:hypothetical protein [Planctomycetota bacterium]